MSRLVPDRGQRRWVVLHRAAPTVVGMNILSNGLTTIFNGIWATLHALVSPLTIAVVLAGASLAWLALLECDELDRKGTKPIIGRH